jgi:DNA-directed RNA polymerase specialized sigma subunit
VTQTSIREFAATAKREGRWWIITVPELDAVTQARNVREIDDMAIGLISALLDLEEEAIRVSVALELPQAVAAEWDEATKLHERALADEKRAAALRRQVVRELITTSGLSQKDAAQVLGLSSQRVQQLAQG